jgi:hypothetical protein
MCTKNKLIKLQWPDVVFHVPQRQAATSEHSLLQWVKTLDLGNSRAMNVAISIKID